MGTTPAPVVPAEVEHVVIARYPGVYCGHPRHGGMFNFGGGELAVTFNRAPWDYRHANEFPHDFQYMERSEQVLARSTDHGRTWPEEQRVIIWKRGDAVEALRARLWPQDRTREELDMSQPGACFFFGRCFAGKVVHDPAWGGTVPMFVTFSLRSVDKGRSWERVPTVIAPPAHAQAALVNAHSPVHLPDGSFLLAVTVGGGACPGTTKEAALYMSDDNGLSWEYVNTIARDPTGIWGYTYNALIQLPGGRLQCYMMRQNANSHQGNWPCLSVSDDGGLSWSPPRLIGHLGYSPWGARRRPGHYSQPRCVCDPAERVLPTFEPLPTGDAIYRSPYPLLLRDGRIVVLYARRKPPYGIGGMVSEDQGKTWSRDFVLRDDANCGDLGYPVATELEDGRIFTAYYYNVDDGNTGGGTRFIAASTFRLPV